METDIETSDKWRKQNKTKKIGLFQVHGIQNYEN